MITYDDFVKLELKVGTILEVADHSNADKLFVVKVDLGDKTIQLVAGVKPYYQAQDLVGKQVVVVANLEPRVLRGVESCGMLLAAQTLDKSQLCIVSPQKEIPCGSVVK